MGLFQRGGGTNLLNKFGSGTKDIIQSGLKNRALKQKSKLVESQGMAKAIVDSQKQSNSSEKKDNTMKYVLIGVGSLAVLGIAFYAIKKMKK